MTRTYGRRNPLLFLMVSFLCASGGAWAQDGAAALPLDSPQQMRGMEAVCTGVGSDLREDPRWSAYPLKVVLAGKGGQYLGEARVTVAKGGQDVMQVRCAGPWALFRLPAGAYAVRADVNGQSETGRVNVPPDGQARLILRFPDIGGGISPQHEPALK